MYIVKQRIRTPFAALLSFADDCVGLDGRYAHLYCFLLLHVHLNIHTQLSKKILPWYIQTVHLYRGCYGGTLIGREVICAPDRQDSEASAAWHGITTQQLRD